MYKGEGGLGVSGSGKRGECGCLWHREEKWPSRLPQARGKAEARGQTLSAGLGHSSPSLVRFPSSPFCSLQHHVCTALGIKIYRLLFYRSRDFFGLFMRSPGKYRSSETALPPDGRPPLAGDPRCRTTWESPSCRVVSRPHVVPEPQLASRTRDRHNSNLCNQFSTTLCTNLQKKKKKNKSPSPIISTHLPSEPSDPQTEPCAEPTRSFHTRTLLPPWERVSPLPLRGAIANKPGIPRPESPPRKCQRTSNPLNSHL